VSRVQRHLCFRSALMLSWRFFCERQWREVKGANQRRATPRERARVALRDALLPRARRQLSWRQMEALADVLPGASIARARVLMLC
jgi:hypothetical protein